MLFIEQFIDEGLGNSAYLIGSRDTKQAVLIDGLRDVDRYLTAAERQSVQIKYALDTHLHADFISGAREIAAQAGVIIGGSAAAQLGFEHQPLAEGDTLDLGAFSLRVMNTPGHTPEHIAFMLTEAGANAPKALFSGGALIVGGAARTDLLSHDLSEPLARQLYHTLHQKLLALPDTVNVYPTHGAGSFCAAPTSSDRVTTIGRERRQNHLTQPQSEDEFVKRALMGLPSYPVYYRYMRDVNQQGARLLHGVPRLAPLAPAEAQAHLNNGAVVLDIRSREAFAAGHIPNAYGIPLDAPLITWAGWLIPFGKPLVLVAKPADRSEATRQLIRIGYDQLLGYVDGGVEAWAAAGLPVKQLQVMTVNDLRERMRSGDNLVVVDARQLSEWKAGHIAGAVHFENGRLPHEPLPWALDQPIAVHCARGTRSTGGVSVLLQRGYKNVWQVQGGFIAWQRAGFEIEK